MTSYIIIPSLDVKTDQCLHIEDGEKVTGPKVPYLGTIRALTYLVNHSRPIMIFFVNFLARFQFKDNEMAISTFFVI